MIFKPYTSFLSFNNEHSSYKHVFMRRMEISVDSIICIHLKSAYLNLQCLQKGYIWGQQDKT